MLRVRYVALVLRVQDVNGIEVRFADSANATHGLRSPSGVVRWDIGEH